MAGNEYRIRPYRPSDRAGFLSLYETVWGHRKDSDWFEWRFEANPYRDGVQMIVAEHDDGIVGAEPLLPFRLRVGDQRLAAFQPVDWIVHPDHRRQGLFTRMTERLLQRFADDAALLFNFPNDALLPGLQSFDWRVVGDVPTSYRVQNPRPLLTDVVGPTAERALDPVVRVGSAAMNLGLAALDRIGAPSADGTVEVYDGVPVQTLARLYDATSPSAIHVPRDDAYLNWRFDNPNWETTTYVAAPDGTPVASLVAATEDLDGCTTTMILDAQPMCEVVDGEAIERLLVRLLRDHRDADVVKAPGWYAPQLRRRYGFWHDSALSASRLPSVSRVAVRPLATGDLDADAWHVDGRSLVDRENWRLTLADLDIE
ncbi:GNAT family N-acetyltransferase [Haloarcula onubensis]|uniref:GNAT family N-acetyltransferase n=1 Tax=Haloarcula onubensis TaxID=2950539 RepID=A0ABU2FIF5_9EURY|nr:GNAT family N-acetyltransferase [Halomicroarcula sp. S3CR25-11]MDS0280545.1 GNAT family N-acetyltransferase [Halomicroarcula sp. S3CR25-11]